MRFGKRQIYAYLLIITISLTVLLPGIVNAQDLSTSETLEGTVISISAESKTTPDGQIIPYQLITLLITKGSFAGKNIQVESGLLPQVNQQHYQKNDRLVILHSKNPSGHDVFMITDYVRRAALFWIFAIFIVMVMIIGGKWGITSLAGMGFSFVIIFYFVLPQIINGKPPVLIALLGALAIVPLTFYLSHGFKKKTHIAIIGTLFSLIITGILASLAIDGAKLTGFASEEAGFLKNQAKDIDMKGLLLAGIIIGTLGILDDITVAQASVAEQLKKANPRLSFMSLFGRSMIIGRDHIASLVNTLVLVYTGASLPLLLLFINNPQPTSEIINYEFVADEIIRMLVGSIGLVIAVPITTALASYVFSYYKITK